MKKNILYAFLLPLALIAGALSTSCVRDNAQEMPVIEGVRITDPEKADSLFTQATPGKLIVIMGKHLEHTQKVLINEQSVTFNPNLNTDHSIIVKIPTEAEGFELAFWKPEVAQTIQVVTQAGTASYDFKVLAPRPVMDRLAAPYPRVEGTPVTVFGVDFLDLEEVYFCQENPHAKDYSGSPKFAVTGYELNLDRNFDEIQKKYITTSEMTFSMPAIDFKNGYLVMESPQGYAIIDFATVPPAPILNGISSDMPIPGSTVEMRGDYFIAITGIKVGDDIVVPGSEVTVSDDERSLWFTMPAKPAATTAISVVTPGGESNALPFYRYETVIVNFDGLGKDLNWSPNAQYKTADGTTDPFVSDGKYALYEGENPGSNWYGTMVYFQSATGSKFTLPGFDVIPADTPSSDVYMMYEVYNKFKFTNIFHYRWRTADDNKDHDWQNWGSGAKQLIPEFLGLFGDQRFDQWYTAQVPLSRFGGFEDLTYGEIYEKGMVRVRLMLHNHTTVPENVFICVDNLRISTLPTYNPE